MIKFGFRQSFDDIAQIDGRFGGLTSPVEVALPYHWAIYEPVRRRLDEIARRIKSLGADVASVHAVQATITDDGFKTWGKDTGEFARLLGAKVVTVHPNRTNTPLAAKEAAMRNLRQLGRECGDVIFSVETFEGKKRVFSPDEIVESGLPMTLDVAHIHDENKIWSFLESYLAHIPVVHLSAKGGGRQHLPIDDFCLKVTDYLVGENWDGIVILEYLPEFHDRIASDAAHLRERYLEKSSRG